MGLYHMDDEVDLCYTRLNDALCTFERNTDIGATLVLVPKEGWTLISIDGKPMAEDMELGPHEAIERAVAAREWRALKKAHDER